MFSRLCTADQCIGPTADAAFFLFVTVVYKRPLHCSHFWEVYFFRKEMHSTRTRKVNSISVRTRYRWNLRFMGFPRIQSSSRSMLGFVRNLLKRNTHYRGRSSHSSIAARHAAGFNRCHEIISSLKVSRGKFCDKISPLVVILLSNDICWGANMLLPPRNKVSVGNTFTWTKIH